MGHHCPNDRFGEEGVGLDELIRRNVPQMIINQKETGFNFFRFNLVNRLNWLLSFDLNVCCFCFFTLTKPKLHVQNIRHIPSRWNFERVQPTDDLLNLTIRWDFQILPLSLSTRKQVALARSDSFQSDWLISFVQWWQQFHGLIRFNGLQHFESDLFQHTFFANDWLLSWIELWNEYLQPTAPLTN